MNIREKIEADKLRDREKFLKEVDDYSFNQKLHYDAMQNELSTIIRNTIPNQLNSLRTLMWVNIVFLGLGLQRETFEYDFVLLFLFVFLCLSMSLYAMNFGRKLRYGVPLSKDYMYNLPNDIWSKTHALNGLIATAEQAIEHNGEIVSKRSDMIKSITLVSFFSLISLAYRFLI